MSASGSFNASTGYSSVTARVYWTASDVSGGKSTITVSHDFYCSNPGTYYGALGIGAVVAVQVLNTSGGLLGTANYSFTYNFSGTGPYTSPRYGTGSCTITVPTGSNTGFKLSVKSDVSTPQYKINSTTSGTLYTPSAPSAAPPAPGNPRYAGGLGPSGTAIYKAQTSAGFAWDPVSGCTYQIMTKKRDAAGTGWVDEAAISVDGNSYSLDVSNKPVGQYWYQVRAKNSSGIWSEWTGPYNYYYVLKAPTAPGNPRYEGDLGLEGTSRYYAEKIAVFKWNASTANGTASSSVTYEIQPKIRNDTDTAWLDYGSPVTGIAATSYACSVSASIPRGQKLWYQIRAKNADGLYSAWGGPYDPYNKNFVPMAPTVFTATPASANPDDKITLTFSGATDTGGGIDKYETGVQTSKDYGKTWSAYSALSLGIRASPVTFDPKQYGIARETGVQHRFRIHTIDTFGVSSEYAYSNAIQVVGGILRLKRSTAYIKGLSYIKVDSAWKSGKKVFIKPGGTWKQSK